MGWVQGKPVSVIKVGGDVLLDSGQREGLAGNVRDLLDSGWQCVILHGGGPQVNMLQKLHGLIPNKVGGRRITGRDDLRVVKQALCGEVNVDLVSALLAAGVPAFGCHGASGRLIEAGKRPPMVVSGAGDEPIDFGEVGDVTRINVKLIQGLLELKQVPVIASLGVGDDGRIFNINADTTVAALASALKAEQLILTTAVGGIFRDINDPDSRISTVSPSSARQLIDDKVITDGMIPKVEEALALLDQGVANITITNAVSAGSFLDAVKQTGKSGTRLARD